ncbi:MAG: molybdopterin-dependent oxidoreductase [Bacteroidia bacterium]|nr:molybdopterin-dependent oxidoreductase [Bacteroidia bacterium]
MNPFNHDLPAPETPLVNVHFNGRWIQVPKGTNVVEVARQHDTFLPHYCYHPKLSISGNCRMCLFEMGTPKMDANRQPVLGADGKPEIAWMPRPQIGCATNVTEGMGIRTDSPLAQECRKGVMEFLLINHPLDCPICDQAGECKLQEFSSEYGTGESRFVEQKVKKPKNVDLGKNIVLDDERCIMCSRCIRFAKEVMKDDVLGFVQRGSHTTLTAHPGKRFDNAYSLNTVDLCPVGALTSKDFRFKMRVWFLKETRSISTWDGTGTNITIGSRQGAVYRITPRQNEAVNSLWMPDQARFEFHASQDASRLKSIIKRGSAGTVLWPQVLGEIASTLKSFAPGETALIASARLSNEELYLAKLIADHLGTTLIDIKPRPQQADGFLVSNDGNPNSTGARLLGVSHDGAKLAEISSAVASGKVKALLTLGEDAVDCGLSSGLDKLALYVHMGQQAGSAAGTAHYILPGSGFGEKQGTMINLGQRLQKLGKAVECPGQAREEFEILLELRTALGGGNGIHTIQEVFHAMASRVPSLEGISFHKIGDQGIDLNSASPATRTQHPVTTSAVQ